MEKNRVKTQTYFEFSLKNSKQNFFKRGETTFLDFLTLFRKEKGRYIAEIKSFVLGVRHVSISHYQGRLAWSAAAFYCDGTIERDVGGEKRKRSTVLCVFRFFFTCVSLRGVNLVSFWSSGFHAFWGMSFWFHTFLGMSFGFLRVKNEVEEDVGWTDRKSVV